MHLFLNSMRKADKKKAKAIKKAAKLRALDKHDTEGYFKDLEYLGRLSFVPEGTRSWIEVTMYSLREKANVYEHSLGELLIKKKVNFIHQAPFVFRPKKIYFTDFYLPDYRIVIEVDGVYHNGKDMVSRDAERDYNFKSIGIRVVRVMNEETKDPEHLSLRLAQYIKEFR